VVHKNLIVRSQAGQLRATHTNLGRDHTDAAVRFLAFVSEQGTGPGRARPGRHRRLVHHRLQPGRRRRLHHLRHPFPSLPTAATAPTATSPAARPPGWPRSATQLVSDDTIALADRVAGLLTVLFAQPVSRICELRLDHIVSDGSAVMLGDDPIPLPEPVAELVGRYCNQRINMATTNTETTYLFPGGRPGEHITAMQLGIRLRRLGITKVERQGALTHLLRQVPAPIVAKATGYSTATTAIRATQTGNDWATYAALKQTSTS
jgi:hypothetical protein